MLIDMALMAVLVFAVMSGRATSIPFIFAAVPVCRVAPPPFGVGGAGFLVLFGSTLAKRKHALQWIVTSRVPGQVRRGVLALATPWTVPCPAPSSPGVEASLFRRDQLVPSRCLPSRGDGHALRWTER